MSNFNWADLSDSDEEFISMKTPTKKEESEKEFQQVKSKKYKKKPNNKNLTNYVALNEEGKNKLVIRVRRSGKGIIITCIKWDYTNPKFLNYENLINVHRYSAYIHKNHIPIIEDYYDTANIYKTNKEISLLSKIVCIELNTLKIMKHYLDQIDLEIMENKETIEEEIKSKRSSIFQPYYDLLIVGYRNNIADISPHTAELMELFNLSSQYR